MLSFRMHSAVLTGTTVDSVVPRSGNDWHRLRACMKFSRFAAAEPEGGAADADDVLLRVGHRAILRACSGPANASPAADADGNRGHDRLACLRDPVFERAPSERRKNRPRRAGNPGHRARDEHFGSPDQLFGAVDQLVVEPRAFLCDPCRLAQQLAALVEELGVIREQARQSAECLVSTSLKNAPAGALSCSSRILRICSTAAASSSNSFPIVHRTAGPNVWVTVEAGAPFTSL